MAISLLKINWPNKVFYGLTHNKIYNFNCLEMIAGVRPTFIYNNVAEMQRRSNASRAAGQELDFKDIKEHQEKC